jgi:SM-20-related protein
MITIQDNLLDLAALDECTKALNVANWTYGWPSNTNVPYGHWNYDITHTDKNNPTDVANRLPDPFDKVWAELNEKVFKNKAVLTRCYANRHTFGTEGYIHTDTERLEDMTCVIYMDSAWDASWGGETVFYDKAKTSIIQAVLPSYGRVVVFPGNIPHRASPLARTYEGLRTTLMFKVSIDPKALYEAEELLVAFLKQIGADKRAHKNGTLADHLIRTYHLIKSNGFNDILALAGGLHSVYGTNVFKDKVLEKSDTILKDRFGSEVDRIVKMFSEINRPSCLENPDGSLSDLDLFLLRVIECANLYDQGELTADKYPNLCKFVAELKK